MMDNCQLVVWVVKDDESRCLRTGAVVEIMAAINCSEDREKGNRWISELGARAISAAVCN